MKQMKNNANNRNLAADLFRVIALLLVIMFHISALSGKSLFNNGYINQLVAYGGEIGITIFFFLSGFGIWHSLRNRFNENISFSAYIKYMKARIIRIVPNYYFHIFVIIFISSSAIYISEENWKTVITHFLFIHNLFLTHHGAINGSLWTMAVIFQFYLVAPFLFIFQKRNPIVFSIIWWVSFLWPIIISGTFIEGMFYGSQITDRLHIFMFGMVVAYLINTYPVKRTFLSGIIVSIIGMFLFYSG